MTDTAKLCMAMLEWEKSEDGRIWTIAVAIV